jgi:hypothetical protein
MQKMTSFRISYDDMKWIHIDKNLAELVIAELMDELVDWADELPTCWSCESSCCKIQIVQLGL